MVMMVVAALPVMAANVDVTVTDSSGLGHTDYVAYQIFTGTQATDGGALGDIAWGTGINKTAFVASLKAAFPGDNTTDPVTSGLFDAIDDTTPDAAAVAEIIADFQQDDANARKVAKAAEDNRAGNGTALSSTGSTSLATGYYLIYDNATIGTGDAQNAALLALTTSMTITKKTDVPTIDKKIKHNESGNWDVVGDNQIGDTVEFRLEISVPDVTRYDSYTYTAYDKLGSELTLDASSVKVYTDADLTHELTGNFISVDTTATATETFKVTITVKNENGTVNVNKDTYEKLYIGYTAVLNDTAKIYTNKQENEAWLTYSNNPDGSGTGETTHKKVYDWTFKIELDKYAGGDDSKTQIADAIFTISETANLTLSPAADGTLDATNAAKMIQFVKESDNKTYRVATAAEIADDNTETSIYITTVASQNIVIKGLDDAQNYTFYEVKAPAGYNRLTDGTNVQITAAYNEVGSDVTSLTYTGATNLGVVEIKNNQGSVLPSTGGIGTTIFYVIGAILVLGAGILLVTRRRVSAN